MTTNLATPKTDHVWSFPTVPVTSVALFLYFRKLVLHLHFDFRNPHRKDKNYHFKCASYGFKHANIKYNNNTSKQTIAAKHLCHMHFNSLHTIF